MPFIGELPGLWYDAEKDKYFKIEADSLAAPSNQYTASTVERITAERRDERLHKKAKRAGAMRMRPALPPGDPAGALFRREMGERGEGDVAAGVWAAELERKVGEKVMGIMGDTLERVLLVDMFVYGDEDTGLPVVFGVNGAGHLRTSYFPPDGDDERDISRDMRDTHYLGVNFTQIYLSMGLGFHALAYDEKSESILMTGQGTNGQMRAFISPLHGPARPLPNAPGHRLTTLNLAIRDRTTLRLPPHIRHDWAYSANVCIATPAASDTAFFIGTTEGILQVDRDTRLSCSWVHAPIQTNRRAAEAARKEIFALDTLRYEPTRVLLAGGRCGQLCMIDFRAPDSEWQSLDHTSSIAHIKALDEHHVLVAGPKNAMAVYDTRYARRNPIGSDSGSVPVLTFPEYKNASDIKIGLDVLLGPGYGSGVVAAAHDDGKVSLFSIRDGRKLRCSALDGVNLARPEPAQAGPAYMQSTAVVKCLKFKTLPEDEHASLFVAGRLGIGKYSFSKRGGDFVTAC